MRYLKEITNIRPSTTAGTPSGIVTVYIEWSDEKGLNRMISSSTLEKPYKYDLEHDGNYEMREFENNLDLNGFISIDVNEFDKVWAEVDYHEYESS